jgi:hypothetical protein
VPPKNEQEVGIYPEIHPFRIDIDSESDEISMSRPEDEESKHE